MLSTALAEFGKEIILLGGYTICSRLPPDITEEVRQSADGANEGRRPNVAYQPMIQLTKLNNQPFAVNADLIKFVSKHRTRS